MQLNILEHLTVSEQDFFDEDDKPMKLKEVLEEVCSFLTGPVLTGKVNCISLT